MEAILAMAEEALEGVSISSDWMMMIHDDGVDDDDR